MSGSIVFPINVERLHGLALESLASFRVLVDVQSARFRRIPYMDHSKKQSRNKATPKKASPKAASSVAAAKLKKKLGDVSAVPLAQARVVRNEAPEVSRSLFRDDGKVRFRHREYIGDVFGSVGYNVVSYPLNPGLSQTFPWLPQVASNYESYLFHDLKVEYETQKSASTNGSVMIAIDFDAADSAPSSKVQLMSYHNAVRSGVWQESCYYASRPDLKKFGTKRFMRFGALASNLDVKTYDVGTLHVATQGCADTSAIGELYITYDVEFETPQYDPNSIALANCARIASSGGSAGAIFGATPSITGGLPISATGNTVTFNRAGQYLVHYVVQGTSVVQGVVSTSGSTASLSNPVPTAGNMLAAGAGNQGTWAQLVNVITPGQTLVTDFSALAATLPGTNYARIAPYTFSLA